jgi:Carboxypeptidase regulatory-like domain/TonB-dependent Receptor Plug Domain
MKAGFKALCLVAVLFLSWATINAQQTGEIRGKVTDDNSEVLPGVTITAKSPSLQGLRTALSDRNGNFRLPLLPVGTYSVAFELRGFEKLEITGQNVRLGFTVSIARVLKPSAVSEEVTVVAPAPLIDKTKADNSYRLNSDELARVPTQTRTIADVVGSTPGVTGVRMNTVSGGASSQLGAEAGLPSFRGEGDAANNWLVDGLSTKSVIYNNSGVRVNFDSWEEVQIISDGFSPEAGQGMGGFINIVTKSGSNDFHGELGSLIRGSGLRAQRQEQLSAATMPETSLSQFYGNLGGPIIKDKLWFFVSDNYFNNRDKTKDQTVGWLTIPAGNRRIGTNNVFGKLTFTPRKNHSVSFGGTLDEFLNQAGGIGVPETYTETKYTDYSYRMNYKGILSKDTLLTAAFGQNRQRTTIDLLGGDYGLPAYFWQDIAQTTNNANGFSDSTEWRTDLTVSAIRYLDLGRWGNHELKAGGNYYANKYHTSWRWAGVDADPWPGNGFDNGLTITWAGPGLPLQLQENGPGEIRDSTRGFGFYVEDNVTLGRVSMMLGLRTDTQRIFNDAGVNVWNWGVGDFLQPRASLAVDLTGDGRNTLKFGFGRFAMPIAGSYLTWVNQSFGFNLRNYDWIGPENPTDAELENPANWSFVWEQSGAATPIEVDPALTPPKMTKFFLEFDRQLGTNWAIKLRGIYSHSHNLLEDIGLYDPETSWVKYLFTNFELKKRNYRALEVELDGRVAGRFMLNASYTWSQAKGTNPGNFFESAAWDVGWGSGYDGGVFGDRPLVPEGAPNKELLDSLFYGLGGRGIGDEGWYGFLPYSVDHIVKVLGTYLAPYGVNLSLMAEYLSGYHWEKKGWSEGYGFYYTFPEGRGGRTTPEHMYIDLAVEKDFRLRNGTTLGLGINAYNLLNSQRPVSFVQEDNELFGEVWARQLPRWVQFKASFRF